MKNSRPWGGIFDLVNKSTEIQKLERKASSPNFWNDPGDAQEVTRRISLLKEDIEQFRKIETGIRDLEAAVELIEEDRDGGEELLRESIGQLRQIENFLSDLEVRSLLGDEADPRNALITINPGG